MVNSTQPLHEETQEPDAQERIGQSLKHLLNVMRPQCEALRAAQFAPPLVDPVAEAYRLAQSDRAHVLKQVAMAMAEGLDNISTSVTSLDSVPMRVAHVDEQGISHHWHLARAAPFEFNGHVNLVATYRRGQFLRSRRAAEFGQPRETRYGIDDEVFE